MGHYITHITFKFKHHGCHSGYDMLTNYMRVDKVINRDNFDLQLNILRYRGLARINRELFKISSKRFYKSIYENMVNNSGVHHFLYPENTLAFFDFEIPPGVRIVSSFHQTPEVYEKMLFNKEHEIKLINYRKTNLAIALGTEQVPVLKRVLKHDRIEVIPHGVDIQFYKPWENDEKLENTVLIVGNWMRDFELVRKVAEFFENSDKRIRFVIVSIDSNRKYFEGLSNVSFLCNVTDETLLKMYQRASALFLPLKGSIANNALLEAMACNLPVMVTNLSTLVHLSNLKGIVLFEHDIDDIQMKLSGLLKESKQIKESGNLREYVKQFRWEQISMKISKAYSDNF